MKTLETIELKAFVEESQSTLTCAVALSDLNDSNGEKINASLFLSPFQCQGKCLVDQNKEIF
jgi:hypothetical protein